MTRGACALCIIVDLVALAFFSYLTSQHCGGVYATVLVQSILDIGAVAAVLLQGRFPVQKYKSPLKLFSPTR